MNRSSFNVPALVLAGVAAVASFGFVGIAHADEESVPTVTISYSDLDLSQPADAARLYGRIETAAVTVCRDLDRRSVELLAAFRQCKAHAIDGAVSNVNNPNLSALHAVRSGHRSLVASSR